MHWFWRVVIVIPLAAMAGFGTGMAAHFVDLLGRLPWGNPECIASGRGIAATLVAASSAVALYVGLTRWTLPVPDGETRCRRCRYILRGISEPRCPECGERL
jgi:hypothetical protein